MSKKAAVELPSEKLSPTDRLRIVSLTEAARLRGCSVDTLRRESKRTGRPEIIKISQRRSGVRLGEALGV